MALAPPVRPSLDFGGKLRSGEAAQPGGAWSPGWGTSVVGALLAVRRVGRLSGRVTQRPAVVRALLAVARSEVRIGEGRCRCDRQSTDGQNGCERFAPHS